MRTALLALLAVAPIHLFAQTEYFVEVGGSSLGPTLPYYAPNVLNIEVGDIVTWENASGTHNVNATTFFFPANPEGFTNGQPSSSSWSYSHTFTVAGTYNYMCTTEGRSATQTGRIIVVDATNVAEALPETPLTLSPTPATDHLFVEVGNRTVTRLDVLGLDGRLMDSHSINSGRLARIPVSALPQGNYILRVVEASGKATALRFSKN